MDAGLGGYERDGFVRVPGAFGPETSAALADRVWAELAARHGTVRSDRGTWTVTEPRRLGGLRKARAFDAIGTDPVRAGVRDLAGTDTSPGDWGGALVTFPTPGAWTVPRSGWHLDYPVRGAPWMQLLLKWLAYLEPVPAGGGGTVVIAGSHRLVADWLEHADPNDPGPSGAVRDALFGAHPWFRTLDGSASVRGIEVRVVELVGEPGDVVFLHPHLLHAAAPNRSDRPRLMVTGGLEVPRP